MRLKGELRFRFLHLDLIELGKIDLLLSQPIVLALDERVEGVGWLRRLLPDIGLGPKGNILDLELTLLLLQQLLFCNFLLLTLDDLLGPVLNWNIRFPLQLHFFQYFLVVLMHIFNFVLDSSLLLLRQLLLFAENVVSFHLPVNHFMLSLLRLPQARLCRLRFSYGLVFLLLAGRDCSKQPSSATS